MAEDYFQSGAASTQSDFIDSPQMAANLITVEN